MHPEVFSVNSLHRFAWVVSALAWIQTASANAELGPLTVRPAELRKTKSYLRDGIFTGGDRAIGDVVVRDIRRAANPEGYERIVIDLEGQLGGEPAAIPRAPYFHVSVAPEQKRLLVSVWGNPRLDFNSSSVIERFRKSSVVKSIELLPKLDDQMWTFALELKADHSIEVFELQSPVRIILDVKQKLATTSALDAPLPRSASGQTGSRKGGHEGVEDNTL